MAHTGRHQDKVIINDCTAFWRLIFVVILTDFHSYFKAELWKSSNLVLWAAVYTTHTPHLTHVHESSGISGTYYSNAPYGVSPIVFMDPRGGQPMHIDAILPETEPEAPFHHQTTFYPSLIA